MERIWVASCMMPFLIWAWMGIAGRAMCWTVNRVVGACCLTETMRECMKDSALEKWTCAMVFITTQTSLWLSMRVKSVKEWEVDAVCNTTELALLCMMVSGRWMGVWRQQWQSLQRTDCFTTALKSWLWAMATAAKNWPWLTSDRFLSSSHWTWETTVSKAWIASGWLDWARWRAWW